jgi:PKHD-type hydroxylase
MPLFHDLPEAFSAAECDWLVALTEASALAPAGVYAGGDYRPHPDIRDVETSFHPRSPGTAWLYERLDALFAEAGQAFGIDAAPMSEPIQLLRYGVGSHFREWHGDAGYDRQAARKISVSVELSGAEDHEGGVLEIMPGFVGRARELSRGGARFFRSQAMHRVTPVTRGVRYALVNWTGGADHQAGLQSPNIAARE